MNLRGWYCHFTLTWPNDPKKKSEYKCEYVPCSLAKLVKHLRVDGSLCPNWVATKLKREQHAVVQLKNGGCLNIILTQSNEIGFDDLHAPVVEPEEGTV